MFIYSIANCIANGGICIAGLFSKKVKLMLEGRKKTFSILSEAVAKKGVNQKVYWMHCASLGEFEQGRPVIERLKKRFPDCFVALSFFSPSGYEIRKDYELADVVFYLPSDSKRNMQKLVEVLNPEALFLVKYELWYNMLRSCFNKHINVYLFSALFQPNMPFFKWYGGFFRKMLGFITHFYVQDELSKTLLAKLGFNSNVFIVGDTRFDRVIENKQNVKELPVVKGFTCSEKEVIVCGSTWNEDMDILIPFILAHREIKFIIAPHNINEDDISSIEAALMPRGVLRYTKTTTYDNLVCPGVLIIDCIGILNSVYQYGNKAYIGGGFGAGIHNILEAAVWGLPLAFGPNYKRFKEAVDLVRLQGACVAKGINELNECYDKQGYFANKSEIVSKYVGANKGAADAIVNNIFGN